MKQVGKFNSWISLRVFLLFTPYSRLELSSIQSLAFKASINFTRHEEKIDWLKPSWIYLRSIPYSILQLLSIQFLALLVSFSAIKHGEKTDWLIPQPLLIFSASGPFCEYSFIFWLLSSWLICKMG